MEDFSKNNDKLLDTGQVLDKTSLKKSEIELPTEKNMLVAKEKEYKIILGTGEIGKQRMKMASFLAKRIINKNFDSDTVFTYEDTDNSYQKLFDFMWEVLQNLKKAGKLGQLEEMLSTYFENPELFINSFLPKIAKQNKANKERKKGDIKNG